MSERFNFGDLPSSYAAARHLERLSDQDFWRLAAEIASTKPSELIGGSQAPGDDFLVCVLAQGYCVLPLVLVREVVSPSYHFTLLPTMPIWMPGTYAWRGEIVAVADLSAYLTNSTTRVPSGRIEPRHGILLIMQHEDLLLGLFVATVETTTSLLADNMKPLEQARISIARTDVVQGIQ